MLLYIGRLMNLIVWLLLIYLGIKITPVHKWVLLQLDLMPMAFFQGVSLSVDSFTIGLSFLIITYIFKLAFDDKKVDFDVKDTFILGLLFWMLALSKQVYCLLIFLFFVISPYIIWRMGEKKLLKFIYICCRSC